MAEEKKRASWYGKGGGKAEPAKKAEAEAPEHPMRREMSAALERHGKERDDMHKRHGEELQALLSREDLMNAQAGAPSPGTEAA